MSGRLHELSDEDLGQALTAVGRDLAVPKTPMVVPEVLGRIRAEERRPSTLRPSLSLPSRRRTLVLLAAAVLLVAAAALATELVLRFGAVTIEIVPSATTSPPAGFESGEAFGNRVSLAEAEARAGVPAAVPAELGAPDDVWVGRARVGFDPAILTQRIVMAWDARADLPEIPGLPWGAVLMQLDADVEVAVKMVSADTGSVASVLVDGAAGSWVTGAHTMEIATRGGSIAVRVTGNVLLWEHGSQTLRLETDVSVDRAIAIAESVG
jgi:hypothetical protein